MSENKTRLEVMQVVLDNFDSFPKLSYGGLFTVLRKREYINWGEWHYLTNIMSKYEKARVGNNMEPWSKNLVLNFIKKLQENERNRVQSDKPDEVGAGVVENP